MPKKKKQTIEELIEEVSQEIIITKNKRPRHGDQELREDGWMTVDEFIETLVPGLREYLQTNWGNRGEDQLHHPVDLFTNASIYLDVACHVSQDFINCRHVKEH